MSKLINEAMSKFEVGLRYFDHKGNVKSKTCKVSARNASEAAAKARKKYQDSLYDIEFSKVLPDSLANVSAKDEPLIEAEIDIDFDTENDPVYYYELALQLLDDIIGDAKDEYYEEDPSSLVDDLLSVKDALSKLKL